MKYLYNHKATDELTTKIANAKAFISLGKLTLEEIASCCNLPIDQVQKLAEEIK